MLLGKHINRYYIKYLPMLLLGILSLLLVDVFQLKIPELYRLIVNGLADGGISEGGVFIPFDLDFLLERICKPLLFIILALVVGRFLWRICLFGAGRRVETDLRERMFARAETLPVSFYHQNKVGSLMALFTNDIETVQDCFGSGVMMFFDALLLGVLAIRKMWNMDFRLTLLSLIPMSILLVVATVVGKYMRKKWAVRQEAFSSLSDFAQESFSGIAVIKAFVKEALELLSFRRLNKQNEEANVAYTKASTLLHISVTMFVESVVCIILGYGGYLVYTDIFTAGELVEFIGYFNTIIWPVMAVSQMIEMQSRGKASLSRIGELLEARSDITDRANAKALENARGEITFQSLTFRYPGADREALKDISFTVKAGERIGVIGRTGCGKTTLADLILRAYPVEDGTLLIDVKDVNTLTVASVRAAAAYVPQDNFLFSDTIAENIAFSAKTRDDEKIIRAARLSDVDDNIQGFEKGYETILGERGVTVSGGQKQRISIARALMKNAPILILDDALSAVDTATERKILENLSKERQGKTTLLIAHRVSSVQSLDRVLVLDEGRLVAFDTHEGLLSSCPLYRNMVELQRLEEEKA
ncbi:MAG: ABC transporter ATP-binding protein [Clostridia bacterium]|nr:ABC transporter ATP-binding protein [Clostridia bacterium]